MSNVLTMPRHAEAQSVPHGLGGLVDVHHHGPLEVGDGAGYGVDTVIVGERTAVFGDVGELVEKRVVAVLGSHVIPQEAMAALDVIAQLNPVDIAPLSVSRGTLQR